jgi:hypothetical protein
MFTFAFSCVVDTVATSVLLSERPIRDFLNHDGFEDVGVDVAESFPRLISDCLRPRIREAEDLGLKGSTASVK